MVYKVVCNVVTSWKMIAVSGLNEWHSSRVILPSRVPLDWLVLSLEKGERSNVEQQQAEGSGSQPDLQN